MREPDVRDAGPESRFDRDGSESWRAVLSLHGDITDDWEDDVELMGGVGGGNPGSDRTTRDAPAGG